MSVSQIAGIYVLLALWGFQLQAMELTAEMGWAGAQRYGFAVNGVVSDVAVFPGQKVSAGAVLARLDSRPLDYRVEHFQARVQQLEPAIFDARQELNRARELYERTVLSEVELQKIEGKYKALLAQQAAEKADLKLAQWQAGRAVLKASDDGLVLTSNILPGLVISDENRSLVYIELVSAHRASATALLTAQQRAQITQGASPHVIVGQQRIAAEIRSISLRADDQNLYRLLLEFPYMGPVEPGKNIKVKF